MNEPDEVSLCKDCPDNIILFAPEDIVELIPTPEPVDRPHEGAKWNVEWRVDKYEGDFSSEQDILDAGIEAYETISGHGNMLVTNGQNLVLDALIGVAITAFTNANARIGVGDSTTAAAAGQTDLQAATNKVRVAMDATYPNRTSQQLNFKSTFGSAVGNFAWQEWGIFNAASGATSMLNRKVESLGTKSAGVSWVFTVVVTIS
jgi:hypothetical protein